MNSGSLSARIRSEKYEFGVEMRKTSIFSLGLLSGPKLFAMERKNSFCYIFESLLLCTAANRLLVSLPTKVIMVGREGKA